MARYSFSGSIPLKFEHKLRRQKQRYEKYICISPRLSWIKIKIKISSGFSNEIGVVISNKMTLLPILLAAIYLGAGNYSSKIVYESFFLQQRPRYSSGLREICKSFIEIFWGHVFTVKNIVKNGQSWCLAIIWRKERVFDMQILPHSSFNLFKTCVKDHEDSSSRLLERRIWLVCIEALLLAVL